MKKSLLSGAATYAKNMGKHIQRVASREEKAREALAGMSRDAKKLAHMAHKANESPHHKRAKHILKKGVDAYNKASYKEAADRFHEAILEDAQFALAYTYLGNAYYQMSKYNDAIAAWRRAIAADPGSDAAAKAQAKLDRVEASKERTVQELQERLRGQ